MHVLFTGLERGLLANLSGGVIGHGCQQLMLCLAQQIAVFLIRGAEGTLND